MFDQLSGFSGPVVFFLKATIRRQITVPGYTRHDGTVVPPHQRTVLVSTDHDDARVLSGHGSHSQRQAHAELSQHAWFNQMPDEHRVAVLLAHATDRQDAASRSAQLSGWRQRARAGQNPTPAQWQAFRSLPADRRAAELEQVQSVAGGHSHLRDPGGPVAQSDIRVAVPSPAPVPAPAAAAPSPAPAPAASRPSTAGVTFYHGGIDVPTRQLRPLTFFTPDRAVAQDYLQNGNRAGSGRVHAVKLNIRNPATDADVEAAAREVGIYSEHENAHQYLTPEVHGNNAHRVMQLLQHRGFDGAAVTDIPMSGGGAPITSWAIFSSDQVTEHADPSPAPAAAPAQAPATARVNDMDLTRQPDGSWRTRAGSHVGRTSGVGLAADYLSGVTIEPSHLHAMTVAARTAAVEAVVREGKDPVESLNALLPGGQQMGPQPGDTKTINGVEYVLRDGRWHRTSSDGAAGSVPAPAVASSSPVSSPSQVVGARLVMPSGASFSPSDLGRAMHSMRAAADFLADTTGKRRSIPGRSTAWRNSCAKRTNRPRPTGILKLKTRRTYGGMGTCRIRSFLRASRPTESRSLNPLKPAACRLSCFSSRDANMMPLLTEVINETSLYTLCVFPSERDCIRNPAQHQCLRCQRQHLRP